MAVDFGGLDITFVAGEAIDQYAPVTLESDGQLDECDATTDVCIGIAQNSADAAGDPVIVRVNGVSKCVAGGVIAAGGAVGPDATAGQCEAYVAGTHTMLGIHIGTAAAAAGDVIPVLIALGPDVTPP